MAHKKHKNHKNHQTFDQYVAQLRAENPIDEKKEEKDLEKKLKKDKKNYQQISKKINKDLASNLPQYLENYSCVIITPYLKGFTADEMHYRFRRLQAQIYLGGFANHQSKVIEIGQTAQPSLQKTNSWRDNNCSLSDYRQSAFMILSKNEGLKNFMIDRAKEYGQKQILYIQPNQEALLLQLKSAQEKPLGKDYFKVCQQYLSQLFDKKFSFSQTNLNKHHPYQGNTYNRMGLYKYITEGKEIIIEPKKDQ